MPLDAEAAAINVLETTAYFQGKRSINNYLNQFHNLIYNSGYTNLKTVIVKFCRGLDRRILTALTGMALGRPSCPNGHRRGTKGQSHSRHLPTLQKNRTLGEGV